MNPKQFLAIAAIGIERKRQAMNPNPLEKEIEKKIGDYAKKRGCLYYKFVSPANRAVPDRMIVTPNGVVGFLEVKRKGCKPTSLQMIELQKLKAQGTNVGWVDNIKDGNDFIDLLEMKPDWQKNIVCVGL